MAYEITKNDYKYSFQIDRSICLSPNCIASNIYRGKYNLKYIIANMFTEYIYLDAVERKMFSINIINIISK